MLKRKFYSNNPRTEDKVKYSIQSLVSSNSPPEGLLAVNMMLAEMRVCEPKENTVIGFFKNIV